MPFQSPSSSAYNTPAPLPPTRLPGKASFSGSFLSARRHNPTTTNPSPAPPLDSNRKKELSRRQVQRRKAHADQVTTPAGTPSTAGGAAWRPRSRSAPGSRASHVSRWHWEGGGAREGQVTHKAPPRGSLPIDLPCACAAEAGVGAACSPAAVGMGLSVRAVFFDLDNTLIDTAGASRKGMLEVMSGYPPPSPGSLPLVSSLLRLPGARGAGSRRGPGTLASAALRLRCGSGRKGWVGWGAACPQAWRLGLPACLLAGS